MANNYNSNPLYFDTDFATGWRANQTLNTGNLPSTAQQFSGAVTRQWGIRISKIQIIPVGTTAASTILVSDPNDATILWKYPVTVTQAPVEIDFATNFPAWRDFKISGLTTGVVALQIWYRN